MNSKSKLMSEHTPGPWELQKNEIMGGYTTGIGPKDDEAVAHWTGYYPDNMKANANLIAAAPELLEALESFVNAHNDNNLSLMNLRIAKEAINKAKGDNNV